MTVDRALRLTLEEQVYRQLRELILEGRLRKGDRLPSSRRFAVEIGVSRPVVQNAYDRLSADGFVQPRPGSGHYVARDRLPPPAPERRARRPEPPSPAGQDRPRISASVGFPHDRWARLLSRTWRKAVLRMSDDEMWRGYAPLREAVARHVSDLKSVDCGPDEVLITSGTTDALGLAAAALAGSGGDVWVENPGFPLLSRTMSAAGIRPVPVPVDGEGLSVRQGVEAAPDARLAVVTPSRQFPLGMPMSLERRFELLAWSESTGAVILENEYDSELRFAGRPQASLYSLSRCSSILLLGSLSKLTYPGLRLGYVVADPATCEKLAESRRRAGAPLPTTAQPALAEFIATGGFARHLAAMRRVLNARRSDLMDGLSQLPGVVVPHQETGVHFTVLLDRDRFDDAALAQDAGVTGIPVTPLSQLCMAREEINGALLDISRLDEARSRGFLRLLRESGTGN